MAITVTRPVDKVSGIQIELVEGGNLLPNTTYFLIMVAYNQKYISPYAFSISRIVYHSDISDEYSFVTTDTHRSIQVTWNNSAGATRYQILISKTSGDFTESGGYGVVSEHVGDLMLDGEIGFFLTEESTNDRCFHTIQLKNDLVGKIGKNLGIIKAEFTGAHVHSLDDLANSIIDAGFGDYLYYDGYNFFFKGWIFTSGTDAGQLNVQRANIIFIKGGVALHNPNYLVTFGLLSSIEGAGAVYEYGCNIDIQNSRYPFASFYPGCLRLYGSTITSASSNRNDVSEWIYDTFYFDGANQYLSRYVDGYIDSFLGMKFRGNSGDVKDITFGQGNNFAGGNHIRCRIINYANLPYSENGRFYNCDFISIQNLNMYNPTSYAAYCTRFYDCSFPLMLEGRYDEGNVQYSNLAATTYSNCFTEIYQSINLNIKDASGNPIKNAVVTLKDKNGNLVDFIEHDQSTDRLVTGIISPEQCLSDINGLVSYYVKFYENHLRGNPIVYSGQYSKDVETTYYFPFELRVAKNGYNDYVFVITDAAKFDLLVVLNELEPKIYINHNLSGKLDAEKQLEGEITKSVVGGEISNTKLNAIISQETINTNIKQQDYDTKNLLNKR